MAEILEYTVTEADSGKTVEKIFKQHYGISSGLMHELKYTERLRRCGKVCRGNDVTSVGDVVTADVSENYEPKCTINMYKMPLEIIYEDDFVLVVNKSGNIETHPCPANRTSTLANAIMYYWHQNGEYHNYHIVNRLDKGTSGLCVIAKNRFSHGVLSGQLKERTFVKRYSAVIHGVPSPRVGVVEANIGRSEDSIIKRTVREDGRYAKTSYSVKKISKSGRFSLADIELETGRTHQIRVHFSYIGHPLVGDWLYGDGDNEKELITRQALHARYISFFHPATKEKITLEASVPYEMKKLLNL